MLQVMWHVCRGRPEESKGAKGGQNHWGLYIVLYIQMIQYKTNFGHDKQTIPFKTTLLQN